MKTDFGFNAKGVLMYGSEFPMTAWKHVVKPCWNARFLLAILAVALILAPAPALAQVGSASIGATVVDRTGGVVPNAKVILKNEASGITRDLRKDEPYLAYADFDFQVPCSTVGDCFARYLVRMREMRESLKIIAQAVENIPAGPINVGIDERTALQLVGRTFGPIPKPARMLPGFYTVEPAQDGERTVMLRRVGTIQYAAVAYHVPAGPHPDFAALARAYGAYGEVVDKTEDFAAAFERAWNAKTAALLELRVDLVQVGDAAR